jgi:hypothetical protein
VGLGRRKFDESLQGGGRFLVARHVRVFGGKEFDDRAAGADAIQRQILSTVFPNPLDVFGGLRFAA